MPVSGVVNIEGTRVILHNGDNVGIADAFQFGKAANACASVE
ncbi:MAG: hypothetical protein ACSLEN_07585 [Candidatus Malihini olakiniferum]